MIPEPLGRALEATGYLANGAGAAPSVTLAGSGAQDWGPSPSFEPEVWWRSDAESARRGVGVGLSVYFKYVEEPRDIPVAEWQREVWNRGFSPLLWLVSPERIDLYNGFGAPRGPDKAEENRLRTFSLVDEELTRLDALAGRLAMETGQFWRLEPRVNRETSVDRRLLRDLAGLESALLAANVKRGEAQALIGRCIFAKYLIDRNIVTRHRLAKVCGCGDLAEALRDPAAAGLLFAWLRDTFNGDMFPASREPVLATGHLDTVARFLSGEDLKTGQLHFFPYRFNVIPVELISAIYEQFVHSSSSTSSRVKGEKNKGAKNKGVYYTPLTAVSLVLDEVFDGLTGKESVLDLTCGSGVFLVEALRRLVHLRTGGGKRSRATIRDTLYNQVFGVDDSKAAVRIAAFSLYLTALELDPHPHPPEALGFEPLEGRTLLVGDAHTIESTDAGRRVLSGEGGLRRFDVIVGNPPWTYTGKAGTAARRASERGATLQPRGQSLDFVARAIDFAHDHTRFGLILSATPFFGQSETALRAARDAVDALAPVTLINLSGLSGWLFRKPGKAGKAGMPGLVLLGRHRERRADELTLVQARWTPGGEQSHTIEIAPSDVTTLPIPSWKRHTGLFKAAFLGRRPDLLLLDELWADYHSLERCLGEMNAQLRIGLIFGDRSRDAAFLKGLPFARKEFVGPFSLLTDDLPVFDDDRAERPRERGVYGAPLVLVKKFMRGGPRSVVAVSERDVVFTDSFYGVSFSGVGSEVAYLLAGILGSALATWHLLMTGSDFGLWMRRLKLKDISALPVPALAKHVNSAVGTRVVRVTRALHQRQPSAHDWRELDDAVFDLYELGDADRIIVRDGLLRAGWQWKAGRERSVEPAAVEELRHYAEAFLCTMDSWLSVSNRRRMRAEIYRVERDAPHRLIRFVLEDQPGPSVVKIVVPEGRLRAVLARIGKRTEVRIAQELVGLRDLRVHGGNEVSIIKPAARGYWLGVCGLEDADAVVSDSVHGGGRT